MKRRLRTSVLFLGMMLVLCGVAKSEEGHSVARVREDLSEFLRAGAESASRDVRWTIPPLSRFDLPSKLDGRDLRTELSTRSSRPLRGRIPISVALFDGERLLRRAVVTPVVQRMRSILAASRDLSRGEVLTASDLVVERVEESKVARDGLARQDEVVGQRTRRRVRRGAILRSSQIETVPIVERGEHVTVILEAGGLTIQTTGRAQQAGGVGEVIRVLNLDSKKEITGRLDRQGAVRVAF